MRKINRRQFLKKSVFWGSFACLAPNSSFCSSQNNSPLPQVKEPEFIPAYKKLDQDGKLTARIDQFYSLYQNCQLCPRRCGVNRLKGEKGICQGTSTPVVASASPHFGEEKVLVGKQGSGTIFFSNCNLRCVFCINFRISQMGIGQETTDEEIAVRMLKLQEKGCRNINLVTPTHYAPNILKAVQIASRKGLNIPLAYNTSAYERLEIIKLLDGIVDIYLPDIKYMDANISGKYSSNASDYGKKAMAAIKEMFRQVGHLKTDNNNNALRGLMIRHLVMPNNTSNTDQIVKWIASDLAKDTYVNIMAQYRPMFKAFDYKEIARPITRKEFKQAITWAREAGLTNLDKSSLRYLKLI